MTGIVNWLRTFEAGGQVIRVRKGDTTAELIGNILESQLKVNIIGSPNDFAQNNAQKVFEIDQVSEDTSGLFNWTEEYFMESYPGGPKRYVLESYDEKKFFDEVAWKIDYGGSYLPVWAAKWNFDGNDYCVVIDNELDCRFGWIVVKSEKNNFNTLDSIRQEYED